MRSKPEITHLPRNLKTSELTVKQLTAKQQIEMYCICSHTAGWLSLEERFDQPWHNKWFNTFVAFDRLISTYIGSSYKLAKWIKEQDDLQLKNRS